MNSKFCIVIPVYNVEAYIYRCLKSIKEQTFSDFEVWIVDDGSSDQTGKICDQFAADDSRFSVIHKENEGVSIARNTGIQKTSGEYLLFFDGDDYIEKDCLEVLSRIADEKQVDAVLYGYYLVENDRITETHLPEFSKDYYEGEEILREVIPKFIGVSYSDIDRWMNGDKTALKKENTALWRSMIRRDVIIENKIHFDRHLKVGEDTCFTTEYLSCVNNCYILNQCLYHLVVRETSTIFQYERDPVSVLKGKLALIPARKKLTARILRKRAFDIEPYWQGTLVMSCIQLAFHFSKNKTYRFGKRYQLLLQYIRQPEVQKAIRNQPLPKAGDVKKIPFLLLKSRQYGLLFLSTTLLSLIHYEFQR